MPFPFPNTLLLHLFSTALCYLYRMLRILAWGRKIGGLCSWLTVAALVLSISRHTGLIVLLSFSTFGGRPRAKFILGHLLLPLMLLKSVATLPHPYC